MNLPTRQEQIAGGLIGLLVGDALGVPYEFRAAEELPALPEIEFDPPPTFNRTYRGVLGGTWSDDGAQALCLLASLLDCQKVEPEDLGRRFLRWLRTGYMAVDGRVFDVGSHTSRVLQAIEAGMPVLQAGQLGSNAKGNGSLMRVLPLVLWHQGSDEELVADAQLQSQSTHGQLTCQLCCALYCLWARRTLELAAQPWQSAVASLREIYHDRPDYLVELRDSIRVDDPPGGTGTGYVVNCLHSARLALEAGSYEQVVKTAVALGNDTDTTACVAGGIAGLRDGIQAIPERWRTQLRGQDIYQPLLERLLEQTKK